MRLLLYLILFLIPTITYSMEVDLTDEDSESPEEQQENNLEKLARAAANKNSQRHQQIYELTEEEKEDLLNTKGLNEPDYAELVKRINRRQSLRQKTQAHQSQNIGSIKEIFLTSSDPEETMEMSFEIPPRHFAVCFYLQVLQAVWKQEQYVGTIQRQHALLVICPNLFLTVKEDEYDFLNNANPYSNQIKNFIENKRGDVVEKYAMMLIATNLNNSYCQKSEKNIASDEFYSKFYYYDLKDIEPETKKRGQIKLHKDISEYVSFCSIYDDEKLFYIQSLSAAPEMLAYLNKTQLLK